MQAAHTAADEYYTIRHAMAWNTDSALFRECNYDFARMYRHKLGLLAANRLSKERIISIFAPTGQRIPGVTSQDFKFC